MKIIKISLSIIIFLINYSFAETIKVACVGDSITYGAGIKDRKNMNYPVQLGKILGKKYEIKNFGNSGSTMLKKGDNLILAAFGGGFTWASIYVKWAYNPKN